MADCCCGCGSIAIAVLVLIVVGLWIWKKKTTRMCPSKARVDGKVIIITGGTAGIGKCTAEEMIKRGAKSVLITGRDHKKGEQVAKELQVINKSCHVEFYSVDLCHMEQVRGFANYVIKKLECIDILVNNAGHEPHTKVITSDGLESCIAGNYFGPFLLTHLLIPHLQKSSHIPRIINLSSSAHEVYPIDFENLNSEKSFSGLRAYCVSKLANVYHTRKLCRELSKKNIKMTVNSVHPGVVATDLFRIVPKIASYFLIFARPFFKTPYEGAQTSIYCCVEPDLNYISGVYFTLCKPLMQPKFIDEELEDKLWNVSKEILQIKEDV